MLPGMNEPETLDRDAYPDAREGLHARMHRAAVRAVLVTRTTAGR
jgi:hypothetical protein